MPMFGTPIAASRREPARAVRLPEGVRLAIIDMVELGDDFISAGKRHNVTAQQMRRWLGRSEAISFLRAARSRFRQSVCAANEAHLVAIRGGENAAAAVHAIRTLEQLADNEVTRPSNAPQPGIQIVIRHALAEPPLRDVTPAKVINAGDGE
jgi:DNA-binding SARP family transcriptional activator